MPGEANSDRYSSKKIHQAMCGANLVSAVCVRPELIYVGSKLANEQFV